MSDNTTRLSAGLVISRLAQSFRLMVGVRDYVGYVRHMQQQHPELTPMTEKAFHRYCIDARYLGKGGGRCPC